MTSTAPVAAAAEAPLMDPDTIDPDTRADPAGLRAKPAARATLRSQAAENPLATFLGLVVVALLVAMLTTTNVRINRVEDKVDARFAAQDAKFDAKFDALDAKFDTKFDALDAKFDEMNLKLTALIAALNATDEVDAAVEGSLLGGSG
ncbi:MAG: hypothetical protein OXC00_01525 [Acidimicrobiaceae bacterium]|nr:hypothetical protein [Acidimicrobiaceae bacterium]